MSERELDSLNTVLHLLPRAIADNILRVVEKGKYPTELRVYANAKAVLCFGAHTIAVGDVDEKAFSLILDKLCGGSMHAVNDMLAEGSFCYRNCRVGVAGSCVYSDGPHISAVTSLCMRFGRAFIGCAESIAHLNGNLLLAGPPSSGKTTMLRDYVRLRTSNPHAEHLCVIDTRCELGGQGDYRFDLGRCHLLSGYNKQHGVDVALRSLSPHGIVLEEVAGETDVALLQRIAHSGVRFIATAHIDSEQAFLQSDLVEAFRCMSGHAVLLSGSETPATVSKIISVGGA